MGFCHFCPSFQGYVLTSNHGKLCRQPSHSHSIVSGTYKQLQLQDFLSRYAWLTVKSTARTFRLATIDGDRCRKDGRGVMEYLKKTEIAALVARDRSICGGVGAVNPPSPNQ